MSDRQEMLQAAKERGCLDAGGNPTGDFEAGWNAHAPEDQPVDRASGEPGWPARRPEGETRDTDEHPETGEREACDKCQGAGWLCDECGAPMPGGSCLTEGCAGDLASAHGCQCIQVHPRAPEPLQDGRERPIYDKDAAQGAIRAALKAGGRVRGGFMHWLKGAPSHVLPELLAELGKDGWHLYYDNALEARLEQPHQDVEPKQLTITRREIGALLAAGNLSYQGVTLLVEEGPGSIDLTNRSGAEVERLRHGMREQGFILGRNPDGVDDTVEGTLLVVRDSRELIERLTRALKGLVDACSMSHGKRSESEHIRQKDKRNAVAAALAHARTLLAPSPDDRQRDEVAAIADEADRPADDRGGER
jgi:hypothetical protein